MRRGGPLRRRTPLRRTPGLTRATLRPWRRLSEEEEARRARVRRELRDRDRTCRLREKQTPLGPCFGHLTAHHLRKASQGGSYDLDNLVLLCTHHNDAVEDHPDTAWGMGLVARRGDPPGECWRSMRAFGIGRDGDPT